MNRKHFSWLLGVTAVVAVLVLLLPGRTGKESNFEPVPLVPGLAGTINDIGRVTILKAGEETAQTVAVLVRGEDGWVVESAGSYPADWERLRGVLAALAQARVIEPKTANPEYFDQLGLAGLDVAGSTAVLVRLGEGEDQVGVFVGRTASDRDGQYVRLETSGPALLADRTIEVTAEPRDWMQRDIVDVAETEVVEVAIRHPDGETMTIRKASADAEDFTLQDIPAGRESQSEWTINALGGVLAALRLDEVAPAESIDWDGASNLRVLTADGVQIDAVLVRRDDHRWVRLEASVHPRAEAAGTDAEVASPEAEAASGAAEEVPIGEGETAAPGESAAPPAEEAQPAETPADRAAAINRRVAGWAYAVPEYKFSVMTRRLDDLLKPLEEN